MSLETTLTDIIARLRQGRFPNEQPKFSHRCTRMNTDAKRNACHAERVEASLSFPVLVRLHTSSLILHPSAFSSDRRVYKLDLFERPPAEAAETLTRYLARARVESGEALETARKSRVGRDAAVVCGKYRSRNRRSQARAAIPEAWRELVQKGDEQLVELLASAVESKAGVRTDDDDVAEFLAGLGRIGSAQVSDRAATPTDRSPGKSAKPSDESGSQLGGPRSVVAAASARAGKLILRGKAYPYHNAKDAMVIVLRELAKGDPTFLERCSQHPDAQGRKRRYIARTPEELYPDREDLREMREALPGTLGAGIQYKLL